MVQVVALALGVVQRQQMTLAESIVDFLRPRQMLVVLDNCEHLLDAVTELVEDILGGAPGLRILATSREAFAIPGERVQPLRSLSVSVENPASSDAVVLFVERVRAVAPGFVLDATSTPVVVELCRRLDGIPLAIELAAARVAMMTPAEIVAHLDERFRLLTGGRRGRVERHPTLRAAIEWSYSLLGDTERTVFDRLGVFPASFDEAAAVAVCAEDGIEQWDVIDALGGLVAKSMIGAEGGDGVTRYQLLETLRHFARDHAGDLDGLRRRHAIHYATVAEQVGVGLLSRDERVWRHRLTIELDNLRAATSWAFDATDVYDVTLGCRIVERLREAGHTPSWGIDAWAVPGLTRVDDLDASRRATVRAAASAVAYHAGDMARAETLGRLAIADSVAFTAAYYSSLIWVSLIEVARGDAAAVMVTLEEGRRLLDSERGPEDWRRWGLTGLTGFIAELVGDRETARAEAHRHLTIARQMGVPTYLAASLANQGHTLCTDSPNEALAPLEEAIGLFATEAGGDNQYGSALMDVAVLRAASGDVAGAAHAAEAAIHQAARTGNRPDTADAVAVAAIVLAGHPDRLDAAATADGARHGPVLGPIPATYSAIHKTRIDDAVERVAASLGTDAFAAARRRGAAMTYDEIIAYTRDQLACIAD